MKYFTFAASILTLFFVGQETFTQVQPDNTSKSLDINQISKRLNKLEESIEELKANRKDIWDKFNILGSLMIASITFLGYYYSNAKEKIEHEREIEISARAIKVNTMSWFMEALLSEDPTKRTVAVKGFSLAFPEEGEAVVKALSESDPSEKVRDTAQESLLKNLVRNKYELEHLYRIYEGEKQPRKITFKNRRFFRAELRHLRTLGLIENQPEKTIGGMPQSGDLRDYVKLTQAGIDHIEGREKYGLTNPRREKNSEFWSSANNN